jgi:hypothetical protein
MLIARAVLVATMIFSFCIWNSNNLVDRLCLVDFFDESEIANCLALLLGLDLVAMIICRCWMHSLYLNKIDLPDVQH